MLTPDEVRAKAARWWTSGEFLRAWLRGEDFFAEPRFIPQIGLVRPGDALRDLPKISREQEALKVGSKKVLGYGYQLTWERRADRQIGGNDFIVGIFFDTADDFLKFTRYDRDFRRFGRIVGLIERQLPALMPWVRQKPLRVLDVADDWDGLLRVCAYFLENPRPNLYVRQLPVAVPTKFIQERNAILHELLTFLLPETVLTPGAKTFEERFGLRHKEEFVRFRMLDETLHLAGLSELSLPLSQFGRLPLAGRVERVFIAENEMNVLTFPPVANALMLFGKGKNVTHLKPVTWLRAKPIFYWGDLDVEGFEFLSLLRSFHPNVTSLSLLMDEATWARFASERGRGPNSVRQVPPLLTSEEERLFRHLKRSPVAACRLEQEKIPQGYVEDVVERLVADLPGRFERSTPDSFKALNG
jgi:hypothetical protein